MAVRTLEEIPGGAEVSEYVGEMIKKKEAERREKQYDQDFQNNRRRGNGNAPPSHYLYDILAPACTTTTACARKSATGLTAEGGGGDVAGTATDIDEASPPPIYTRANTRDITAAKHSTALKDRRVLHTLDGTKYGNVSRMINHHCSDANVIVRIEYRTKYPRLALYSLRKIEAGEELLLDYNPGALPDADFQKIVPCLCKSTRCRGWVF